METVDHRAMDARRAFIEHVRNLREIPQEEFDGVFSVGDIKEISDFQETKPIREFIDTPIPDSFLQSKPEAVMLLICNTSTYDEAIEDSFYEDPVILALQKERRDSPMLDAQKAVEAMRARRSILLLKKIGSHS